MAYSLSHLYGPQVDVLIKTLITVVGEKYQEKQVNLVLSSGCEHMAPEQERV